MANISYAKAKNVRVFKDGAYLKTLTDVALDSLQNTIDRNFIGDDEQITIGTTKEFSGSFTRDNTDEHWLETIVGKNVTKRFNVTDDSTDAPDTVRGTVGNGTPVDISFTTPNKTGLVVNAVHFNCKKVGSFTGGLTIEIWEGAAVVGTLKETLTLAEGDLPSRQEYMDAFLADAAESAVTANTAHTLRFKATGTPSGTLELYGPTAVATVPYYVISFEMADAEEADYVLDVVVLDDAGAEIIKIRDTGITFTSDGLTISPSELISEANSWRAKKREIL